MKLFALLVVVIFVTVGFIGMGGGEEVIPPNPTGFIGDWHPAPECGQCHVSLLSKEALLAKLGSCNCHREEYTSAGLIDGDKIRKNAHGSMVCIDCHVGSGIATSGGELPCDDLHRLHSPVYCQACHDEGVNILIPASGNCNLCHRGDAHAIHGNNTGNLCVSCHGSFGIEYKAKGYLLIDGVPVEQEAEEMTYPTITNIFKAILNLIKGPEDGGAQ
jgi:hypothetical protein